MYILSAEPSPPIFLLHSFFLNYQAKPETRLFYTLTTSELTIDVHENQLQFIYVNTTFIFVSFNFTRKVLKGFFELFYIGVFYLLIFYNQDRKIGVLRLCESEAIVHLLEIVIITLEFRCSQVQKFVYL